MISLTDTENSNIPINTNCHDIQEVMHDLLDLIEIIIKIIFGWGVRVHSLASNLWLLLVLTYLFI